jgi:hypothetical protein
MNMSEEDKSQEKNYEPDRDIIYYYSREHRLDKASKAVRDFNEGSAGRQGFIKTFVKNKGNVLVLFTIVMISVMIMIYNFTSGSAETSLTLGNNSVTISIVEEESVLVLSIVKTVPGGKDVYTGAIDIAVSPVLPEGEGIPALIHRIFFSLNTPETYYIVLPFEAARIMVILQTEYETVARTIRR